MPGLTTPMHCDGGSSPYCLAVRQDKERKVFCVFLDFAFMHLAFIHPVQFIKLNKNYLHS